MCTCSCQSKEPKPKADEPKSYVCYQCNAFKKAPAEAPPPECCGKKMDEMD